MRTHLARIGTWAVSLVIGIVYGIAGTIGQAASGGWFPLGLVVALIGVGGLLAAVRLLTDDRWTTLATAVGAMLSTLVFSGKGPGGSVVVPAPAEGALSTGIVWTLAVPIIAAVVIAWPKLPAGGMPADAVERGA
ncbi:DUF6113 family protein [Microbacterium sp.]|uniref:DUF6113 family protein n=1 Tax=Microbacterium sp. TaxID=51671 RepID=UPI0025D027DE|nr:DUF6113 family protein [Microbacterium sp.]